MDVEWTHLHGHGRPVALRVPASRQLGRAGSQTPRGPVSSHALVAAPTQELLPLSPGVGGKETTFPSSDTLPLQETRAPERRLCRHLTELLVPTPRYPGATPWPPGRAPRA